MNRSNIEWCQWTWNPVTGCKHGCPYCYARGIARRFPKAFPNGFEPTFHESRLDEPEKLKKPAHIFAVSMGDLFGEWVPKEWIERVVGVIHGCPQHTFTVLTKNPRRAVDWFADKPSPRNLMIGTSIVGADPEQEGFTESDRKSVV